jgi:tripartite-type tricarboxylate transporter receptor subunit TctC
VPIVTAAALALLVLASAALPTFAQSPFFQGKTIRIVVGFSAGGGYDTFSRTISRHLGRHVPGNPSVIVENMPGAGSLIAANTLYRLAKPDGLTIGNFAGGLVLGQVIGQPGIEFDARKFAWVGVPSRETSACALTKASGITTLEKWLAATTPVKLGGTSMGATTDDVPRVLAATIGVPVQLVSGYKGTSEIRLAAESGEIAGGCWQWESIKSTWRKALDAGEVSIVLQIAPKPHPDLPNVPLADRFAKTDEARQVIHAGIVIPSAIGRLYALPPRTPPDRVATLRAAFLATMRDPEFVADATRAKLEVDAIGGDELERLVVEMFKLNPAVVAKLKEIRK